MEGVVATAPGVAAIYRDFVDNGWGQVDVVANAADFGGGDNSAVYADFNFKLHGRFH